MKKFNVTVNGVTYEVDVEEIKEGGVTSSPSPAATQPTAQPKPEAKPAAKKEEPKKQASAPAGAESVEAPMPGNVWKIQVKEGQEVKEGDVLIILEAMKMENEINAPCDGTVATLHVDEGASVENGDVLVSLK